MRKNAQLSQERTVHLYHLLQEEGVYAEAESGDDEVPAGERIRQALDHFVSVSEAHYGPRNSQLTRNIGRVAYLQAYVDGADEEGLRQVIAELGWSTGHGDLDALAETNLIAYPRLLRTVERAGQTAPGELEDSDIPQQDLDESILAAIDSERIPRSYGGLLRLYLGRIAPPAGTNPDVLQAAYSQAGGKLKVDIAKRTKINDTTPSIAKGLTFLERYNAGIDITSIALEEYPATKRNQDNLAEAITRVESLMALALEELYK